MLKLYSIVKKLSNILVYVSYAVLLGATFFTTYSVFARYVLKNPLLGSVEIIELIMSAMVFASLAYTQTEKGHIHITMLIRLFQEKIGNLLFAVCGTLSTIISGAATIALFQQGMYALKINLLSLMMSIPFAPFYFFAAVCMVLMTVTLGLDTIIAYGSLVNKEYREHTRKGW